MDKNKDDIHVQEAIFSSLKPEPVSPAHRAMSEHSNDINTIINTYSRDDHDEREADQCSSILQEQLTYLDQLHLPLETKTAYDMRKQTANSLLNYLKFYQGSIPPDGFKASMEPTANKPILDSPWKKESVPSVPKLELNDGENTKPKIKQPTKIPGIIPTGELPGYVAPKINPDGPDELESYGVIELCCRRPSTMICVDMVNPKFHIRGLDLMMRELLMN